MTIDLPTLMVAGSFVAATSSLFLIFAWFQNRDETAPLWWAGANITLAAGVPLITASGMSFGLPSMVVGILLLNLSPALIFAAACAANRKRPNLLIVGAGGLVWLVAFAVALRLSVDGQMALNLAVVAMYLFAAAGEFWAGRNEQLMARWPLIVLLVLHGIFFAVGSFVAGVGVLIHSGAPTLNSWFGLIHFETLAFIVGTAIFTVAMVKERSEREHKTAAQIDPLTGVATRRAFLENAKRLLDHCLQTDSPLALIVLDLDRFKDINDGYGHAMGDRVLEQFGATAKGLLRTGDLIGRPGGEEFAVVLPDASVGAAYVAAERIRSAFAEACIRLGMDGCKATVSAGVAAAHPDTSLDSLFADADRALYEAKALGRDRVRIASRDRQPTLGGETQAAAAQAA